MFDSKKLVKVVSVAVASMSLLGVSSVAQAASFNAPKLGVSEVAPTNPSIKKGDKIVVTVKDTKNQKVSVLNANGKKTNKKVSMGSTFTAKAVKKANGKKIVKINKSQWLNVKDVIKD
ncbi:hypothetical protein IMAU10031_00709 [Lactobacillus helveticus]|uniref:hypothetical protein n=1 Tax=Lactobacillus helveticus TaxID=1587 RepID=UPI00156779D0|nr:hypothetical protein [Lactobacillus helveticus]MCO0807732.1 hypothetical protein [Lactobacillus helveticus]NRO03807.1 hypothetical protein [Lactobacillus helveticus]NRO75847.1 hypothetical protein [Lactobacillus helveticus]